MAHSVRYQVRLRVRGDQARALATVFAGLALTAAPDGTTVLSGELPDQAALHGLLAAVRDLGLSIVSVETAAVAPPSTPIGG